MSVESTRTAELQNPQFAAKFIPFHLPEITEDEIQAVVETLRSGWLTTGSRVKQFEENFAGVIGASHAVALNSCTAALHLALEAVGVKAGDEVIVPTMTFTATAEVAIYLGARPVLVDCEPDTLNLDCDRIEEKITNKTKAIVPVHFGGQPCRMEQLLDLAKRHGLKVIEDAAHALPAYDRDRRIGTIGDITCFSFYATKTITTGEGGMATTENSAYADRMRMMSLHGISKDAWKRYTAEGSWYYEVHSPGYKYNLTDIAAAIGIEQLKKCLRFWEARKRIAAMYTEQFSDLLELKTPLTRPGAQHSWHLYVIQLELARLKINRNEFIEALKAAGIGTSVHFIPLHLHPYYRDTLGYQSGDFPKATAAFDRIVSLPIYPKMSEEDVQTVVAAVKKVLRQHSR